MNGHSVMALIFVFLFLFSACSVSNNPLRQKIKMLQTGLLKDDTSYVYALPYEAKKKVRVLQGYFGGYSHKERAALDFNLKKGSQICAARKGVVVRVKEDGRKGGVNKKYRKEGNHIIIQHEDGSRAGYWHLQYESALVAIGDTVLQGQAIGLAGKTGYALVAHLHFIVWTFGNDSWMQVPTRFQTTKGIIYLKALKKYSR